MQGLDLLAQGQDLLVICAGVAVNPLAQNTLGVVGAGEFSVGVQGFAQVAGPSVVGGLRALGPVEHSDSAGASLLHPLYPQQIKGRHSAEQQNGQQCRGNSDKYSPFDTLAHN